MSEAETFPAGPPLALRPSEVVKITGLPKGLVWDSIHNKTLPSIKRGSRYYVPRALIAPWIEEMAEKDPG